MNTVIIGSNCNLRQDYPYTRASEAELSVLSNRLGTAVAHCLQSISQQHEEIIQNYNLSKDKKLLSQGIWYPSDYIQYLHDGDSKGVGKTRYQWLRQKDHLAKGYLDHKQFDPICDQTRRRSWEFLIKKELLPSDALKTAINGLSILDCGAVVQIARYKALLDTLGDDKFNRLFQGIMNVGYGDDELQPMRYFVDFTKNAKRHPSSVCKGEIGNRPIQVGDVVSMNGVPSYTRKHPSGMASNFNVVCLDATPGAQRFVGHGLPSQGFTEQQINIFMIEEYNRDYTDLKRVTDENLLIEKLLAERAGPYAKHKEPLENPEKRVRGYDYHSAQAFNVSLVYDLVQLPPDQISIEMVKSHPHATKQFPI